jgi:hypothetical protein
MALIFAILRERRNVQQMHSVAYPRLIQTKSGLAQMPKMAFLSCLTLKREKQNPCTIPD